jgi:S-adenosylmethionine hydrolase
MKEKTLHKEEEFTFEVKEELRIGTMRVDFADGGLSNKWTGTKLMGDFIDKFGNVALNEAQETANDIQFKLLDTFDKVVEECGGNGYKFESNRFSYSDRFNYWIRLLPVKGDYNYYIKVYLKEEI